MPVRFFAMTAVSMVFLGNAFADQREDYSGDITTGIDIDYLGTDNLYVTYYGGTVTNGTENPFVVKSSSNAYTNVDVGYRPDGNLGTPAGTIDSQDIGVYIEASSQLVARNATDITSLGEGIHFSVYDNGVSNTLYNQGSVISSQTGVYLNQFGGDATIHFQNDGYVSSSGPSAYTAVMIDNGGDPALGSFTVLNNGTIEGVGTGVSGIHNADNATKSITISNTAGGIVSADAPVVYISGGSASTMIDTVSISNAGTIEGNNGTNSVLVYYANSVSITNSGTMTGTAYVERVGSCDFKNSGTISVTDGGDAVYFNADGGTFEHMSGSTINGNVYVYGNSTLVVHDGANKITGGGVYLDNGTILKLVFNAENLGSLIAASDIDIDGVTLLLDVTNAENISILDQYTVVSSDTVINGGFLDLSQGETFWEGNYEFQITYGATDISLTVLNIIPEPSSYASVLGLTVLGGLALRRRRK